MSFAAAPGYPCRSREAGLPGLIRPAFSAVAAVKGLLYGDNSATPLPAHTVSDNVSLL